MSRFFAQGASSSESETSLSEEEYAKVKSTKKGLFEALSMSEDEESESEAFSETSELLGSEDESAGSEQPTAPVRKSRFMFASESESEEESLTKHIKSQKEKVQDEIEDLVDGIEEAMESNDWVQCQEKYDRLMKLVKKYDTSMSIPHVAYLLLPNLEKSLNKFNSTPELKTLNAVIAKAYNALRQKVRKAISQFSTQIERADKAINEEVDESVADSVSATAAPARSAVETPKVSELTPETLLKRLQEIISMRGRKHVDKHENSLLLRKMIDMSSSRRHTIHVLVALVATNLELSHGSLGYMSVENWISLLNDMSLLIKLFQEEESEGSMTTFRPDEEELGLPTLIGIRGSMISYMQRLDDEFTRALQNIDPHSSEYTDFLKAEPKLFNLLDKCRNILQNADLVEITCQLSLRQLDHIYCKTNDIVCKYFECQSNTVTYFCRYLYEHGSDRQRIKTLLYHVYWLAFHDNYLKARDLMMSSHIQEALSNLEISTQILYNRALVQVGLAAFRSGHFKETYFALHEICSTGRPKELLAQGLVGQKYTEKGDMDRLERQRLIPFHMQINVELIDCIFLTVSMLLEIPQNAASSRRYFTGERRLFQSRHLRRILDSYDRNLFNGPPENTRENIVAATKALANGNWRECEKFMMNIKVWDLLTNPSNIRNLIKHKIRESGLYAFLYSSGCFYSSLSVEKLSKEFDLSMSLVVRIVTRLIGDFGIPANMSEDNSFIIWNNDKEPTPTQEIILHLNDKIHVLEERNNETEELLCTLQTCYARNLRNQETLREATSLSLQSAAH